MKDSVLEIEKAVLRPVTKTTRKKNKKKLDPETRAAKEPASAFGDDDGRSIGPDCSKRNSFHSPVAQSLPLINSTTVLHSIAFSVSILFLFLINFRPDKCCHGAIHY
jgi:hypothetical protein